MSINIFLSLSRPACREKGDKSIHLVQKKTKVDNDRLVVHVPISRLVKATFLVISALKKSCISPLTQLIYPKEEKPIHLRGREISLIF